MSSRSDGRRVVLGVARWPVGGIRTYLRDLFRAPAMSGYALVLIAPNEERFDDYIASCRLDCLEWISPGPSVSEMTRAVSAALGSWKPTLVHSHGFISGVVAGVACQFTGISASANRARGADGRPFQRINGPDAQSSLGNELALPSRIHSVTADSRDNLLNRYPWLLSLKRKAIVIPHGIDSEKIVLAARRELAGELGCSSSMVIFGFLGRFMPQKAFGVLIDAVTILKERGFTPERVRVLAVESGAFIREDRARIVSLGLDQFFTSWSYQADIASILKGIDCLLMPSLWEASGLLMEAMVAGTPVIGTDCIGLRETLANWPAGQVQSTNPHQLSEAIASFIARPDKHAALQSQLEAIRRFSADRSFASLRDLYDRMR